MSRFVRAVIEVRFWLLLAMCVLGCKTHASHEPPIADGPARAACPSYLDLELIGASSRFDPGWTGSAHGVGLPQGSQTSVKVDECDADCRRCKFHGPVRGDPAAPVSMQRCLNKVSQVCGGPADPDCGASGPCRFVFPPIASNVGLDTCGIAYFEPLAGDAPAVQGVMDLETGQSDLRVLNLQLALSFGKCVACAGDSTSFDGNPGGKCGGTGAACDVNGVGTEQLISTSFDCPPSLTGAVTINLASNGTSTSSIAWTMDGTRPKCTTGTPANRPCWCGMCDNGTPCTSTKDCPSCGAKNPLGNTSITWAVSNNNCSGPCNWDATTQSGRCTNANNMTIKCFPDSGPMIATGFAEVHDGFYITQLANLICMPSFNVGTFLSGAVDVIGGFPGPFLFQARFRVTKRGP